MDGLELTDGYTYISFIKLMCYKILVNYNTYIHWHGKKLTLPEVISHAKYSNIAKIWLPYVIRVSVCLLPHMCNYFTKRNVFRLMSILINYKFRFLKRQYSFFYKSNYLIPRFCDSIPYNNWRLIITLTIFYEEYLFQYCFETDYYPLD